MRGPERHKARRIDNQLRGRSGRQGDPGETQFFVSLEDSLMRVFASDVIKRVMGTFKIPEDEPIYNSMITKSLEKAQTRIEELNFDARKHVLAYADVLNIQRKSVYMRRRALLMGNENDIDEELARAALGNEELEAAIIKKKEQLGGSFYTVVRRFLLQTTDFLWVEHLEAMEYLRNSVNLRAYGQRDPLFEYKKEGLRLFQQMEDSYVANVGTILPNLVEGGTRIVPEQKAVQAAARTLTQTDSLQRKVYERNDRVKITNGTETREMKYKKAESLLASGEWRIVP